MLYILYIATTLVGDQHLFQIRANVLFVLLCRLEIKFSYSYSYLYKCFHITSLQPYCSFLYPGCALECLHTSMCCLFPNAVHPHCCFKESPDWWWCFCMPSNEESHFCHCGCKLQLDTCKCHPLGLYSLRRRCLISLGIPIINLRWSSDCLRFIMGIPIPIRRHLLSK